VVGVGWLIEEPTVGDAEELGRVHVEVWRQAYAGLMAADYLSGLDPQVAAARWQEVLGRPPGEVVRLVGVSPSGEVVAMATSGPSRDEDAPTPWELWAINVHADHHGSGLADLLMERLVGDRPASLWVARGNDRAAAFYARHGFVIDGAEKTDDKHGTVEDRMVRGVQVASEPVV
jgi:GNAT superfamily N-acetyltransferase